MASAEEVHERLKREAEAERLRIDAEVSARRAGCNRLPSIGEVAVRDKPPPHRPR